MNILHRICKNFETNDKFVLNSYIYYKSLFRSYPSKVIIILIFNINI